MAYPKNKQLDFKGMELIVDRIQVLGTGASAAQNGAAVAISYTTGSPPVPNGAVTVANAATPTVAELLEICVEINAKLNNLLSSA